MATTPGSIAMTVGSWLQEALALHRAGRLDEAEALYRRVLKADRNHFDALHLSGLLHHQRGKSGEAQRLIGAALKIQPRNPDALANMGLVLHALRRSDEALTHLDRALSHAPDHLEALNNRGNVRLALGRAAEALADFERVLALEPRHVQAQLNRGHALAKQGHHDAALAAFDAALGLNANNPAGWYNRGTALHALARHAEAVAAFDRALALMPQHATAWYNRGLALQALNRHVDAVESLRRAQQVQPEHHDAAYAEAASLLTLGRYEDGFVRYEQRWKRSGMASAPRFKKPAWRGEGPLAGKTIFLHAEQGLGDTLQFVRYAPLLAARGARVVLEVQPALKTLLQSVVGVSQVIARGETIAPFDLHCPLGSLPLAFGTTAADVPASLPYLAPDPARIERWSARLDARPGRRIAFAWAGNAAHANDSNRSIPLSLWQALWSLPGLHWVSVQRDLRAGDAAILAESPVTALGADLDDFADTAAVLAVCDRVIAVDTAVAHLAGALARPLDVLLPFQPDWRWTLGARTPWYPQAVLRRQESPGDWSGVMRTLQNELASGDGSRA